MIVLGSTGSIGVNTLVVAKRYNIEIELLSAGRNVALLNEQIAAFSPKYVVISDVSLKAQVNHPHVYAGDDALLEVLSQCESTLVVNAIVGFAGLRSTQKALSLGKRVALANKESLVTAGAFIDTRDIIPIDSEHFALSYLVQDKPISKMTITASGGSFRDYPLEKLKQVSVKEALNHPNWSMGQKITIDSATMMNKLYEILEAKWLFPRVTQFDAIMEPKSIIHAIIDFKDGSSTAHLAGTDMKLPIAYAIKGEVEEQILTPINLLEVGSLEFRPIETSRYPVWEIKEDILKNPHLGVVVNAVNEVAVEAFLQGKMGFLEISKTVLNAYEKYHDTRVTSIEDVFEIDAKIRQEVNV